MSWLHSGWSLAQGPTILSLTHSHVRIFALFPPENSFVMSKYFLIAFVSLSESEIMFLLAVYFFCQKVKNKFLDISSNFACNETEMIHAQGGVEF